MTLNLHLPSKSHTLRPVITVIGVGGAGGNAVNNMINSNLEGVDFVVANTDAQALDAAMTDNVIQLGTSLTQGLGAGAMPEVGRAAAEESLHEIASHIENANMVFITAGMGGGTGTGAAPVIARMAKEQGILTVGVVTKPFQFEGAKRMRLAEEGLRELQQYVDTLIVIPNQNLFRIANVNTTFADAFRLADEVLHSGVRGVTDLMVKPGLVNLDFADIRAVMREMGKAMMGTGEASGEKRATEAAEAAISNPLLDDVSLKGARAALINITGGSDMTLFEVDEAANRIREEIDPDANIIFGSTFNDALQGTMRVSVVATGIDSEKMADEINNSVAMNPAQNRRNSIYMPPRRPSGAASGGAAAGQPQQVTARPVEAAKSAPVATVTNGISRLVSATTRDMRRAEAPKSATAPVAQAVAEMAAEPEEEMPVAHMEAPQAEEAYAYEEYAESDDATDDAEQTDDHGPLFVKSERGGIANRRPAGRADRSEREESASPFGFINRIAEVGRALSQRSEETGQEQRSVRVEIASEKQTVDAHGREEENYEIPAFLRRQAN